MDTDTEWYLHWVKHLEKTPATRPAQSDLTKHTKVRVSRTRRPFKIRRIQVNQLTLIKEKTMPGKFFIHRKPGLWNQVGNFAL